MWKRAQAFSGKHWGLHAPAPTAPSPALVAAQLSRRERVPAEAELRSRGPCQRHRARAAGAQWQTRRVPAGEGTRPFPAHPRSIMTLQVRTSASVRQRREERDALSVCVMPCWRLRYFFSIRIFTAKSRLLCGKGNLPKPLAVK